MERTAVIVVAGGSGSRMGGRIAKQFRLLGGVPVLARTINAFSAALPGAQIVVALPAGQRAFWQNLAARFEVAPHTVVAGGTERFHSVRNALEALAPDTELVAVQDGVRPLVTAELIRRMAAAGAEHGAAIPVVEVVDSLRQTDGAQSHPVDRSRLRAVQTPQVFRAELLRRAYEAVYRPEFTDDASVVEACGHRITLCPGERQNLKITTPEDLLVAEALLAAREEAAGEETPEGAAEEKIPEAAGDGKEGAAGGMEAAEGAAEDAAVVAAPEVAADAKGSSEATSPELSSDEGAGGWR